MVDKLVSAVSGSDIESKTESKILLDYIKNNWTLTGIAASTIDFGAHPSRSKKAITVNCYRVISNVYDENIGSQAYAFDVPVAVDVYVRDIKAAGLKNEPAPKLVSIKTYLCDFISANRRGLRNKGINNMALGQIEYPDEPSVATAGRQMVWSHLVITVRMYYHMFRVPV